MNFFSKMNYLLARCVYKAVGMDFFAAYDWMMKMMALPSAERDAWRLKKLGDILEFAWLNVPFYREYWGDHGVAFTRPKDIEELSAFPILTKKIFRENSFQIRPVNLKKIRHREWSTGGTTGAPVQYLRDLEQWTINEAFHLWGWCQIGYTFGDHVGVIAGGSLVPEKFNLATYVRSSFHRRLFLYGVSMDEDLAKKYYRKLRNFDVKYLYGYPSILYLFGQQLKRMNLFLPNIRGIVTTAEMLLPHYREGLEENFNCRVYNNLGCNDGGFEAYECPRCGKLHYNYLQSILESEKLGKEKNESLIITNLWNKSTPFIRYENGDQISLSKKASSCGCKYPVIDRIIGRTADILKFTNGQSIAGPALTLIFRDMKIDGWQVVQTGVDKMEVRVCCGKGVDFQFDKIEKILRHHISQDIAITIKRVEELSRTKGGKLKPIWTEVEAEPSNATKRQFNSILSDYAKKKL
jgi:phenylacetate-CoA ligase